MAKPDVIRCFQCNKKCGLMAVTCKCGAITCLAHTGPGHNCTYDYRKEAAEKIARENQRVVADKLKDRL